jgi:tRNA1(Val) A37 N6-methylase TrmN6
MTGMMMMIMTNKTSFFKKLISFVLKVYICFRGVRHNPPYSHKDYRYMKTVKTTARHHVAQTFNAVCCEIREKIVSTKVQNVSILVRMVKVKVSVQLKVKVQVK